MRSGAWMVANITKSLEPLSKLWSFKTATEMGKRQILWRRGLYADGKIAIAPFAGQEIFQ